MNKTTDYNRFLGVMARYTEVYHESISETALSDYFWALKPFSIEAMEETVPEVMRREKFFPRPATIAEYAQEWHRSERQRMARERAEKSGLAEQNPLTPEEETRLNRKNEAERAKLRAILARPSPDRGGPPAPLRDTLRETDSHG